MKTLLTLNGTPYGDERTYNGLRLAGALAGRAGQEVRVFLMGDAALWGKPSSTLGFEKRWNLVLSLDRAAFIDHLTRDIPPRPAGMEAIVRANLGLAGAP